jgi:hypothetical protein
MALEAKEGPGVYRQSGVFSTNLHLHRTGKEPAMTDQRKKAVKGASLMFAGGPGALVWHDSKGWHERRIAVLDRLPYAPLVAIPWAVVGGIVGGVVGLTGGWRDVVNAVFGMIGGICLALFNNPFDGWLTLTMPIYAFTGTFLGLFLLSPRKKGGK